MGNICSDLSKMIGTFCLETGESGSVRLVHPHTNTSGDRFKACSLSMINIQVRYLILVDLKV
jgi:hypothetical protein